MDKLFDCEGFLVFGAFGKAKECIAKDGTKYPFKEGFAKQSQLNEAQILHNEGIINVHDPCYDWRTNLDKKGLKLDSGTLRVFPSIAQQWKNQMKGVYVRPTNYITKNPDQLSVESYERLLSDTLSKH